MTVLVGIIGNTAARYHEFTASALKLEIPDGGRVEFLIGGDWCGARNTLAQMTLEDEFDYLWFMDDDHSFAPDLLKQLLQWKVALVTPMCLTRVFPFSPVSYVVAPPGAPADFMPIDFGDMPSTGLVQLAAGGAAGMLIRRDVLQAIEPPWFEYTDRSEDIVFCEKAIEAGFTLYGDLGARLGHITTAIVVPRWDEENGWTTLLRIGAEYEIVLKNAYDMIGRAGAYEVEVETEEISVGAAAPVLALVEPEPELPPLPPPRLAERIEIWQAEDSAGRVWWWWRAIDDDGAVLAKDSAIHEDQAVAAAMSRFPECAADGEVNVYQIARELDDSRNIQTFGPPRRLWNREPE